MPANMIRVGDWELVGNIGEGGFGEVKHWINRMTNQEIATKHIKDAKQMCVDQLDKLKERWQQEYNWTRTIQEPFIVSGITLSNESREFIRHLNQQHIGDLPVIILEYCNNGDVRKLLQRPQNANGLMEFEVRSILGALRQAVDFLHTSCRIYHRDLKPDNILIHKLSNGHTIYKLADFGLARISPDQTMLQSVVGTRHYYAPEVVFSGHYNTKVDYWSMGIIAYELATGVLPFIPHRNAFDIHKNLRTKNRNCIAITENHLIPDDFIFHMKIPMGSHLSQPWLRQFTKWLQLALDTNYSQRGVLAATDEVQEVPSGPAIFTEIDHLLNMKVLTLFAACCYKRLEYEVTHSMTLNELSQLIEKDTDLPSTTIYFVLPTGHPHKHLNSRTRPLDLYVENWCDTREESGNPPVMVYIFNVMEKCVYMAPDPSIPPVLQYFINNGDRNLPGWLVERLILDLHYLLRKEQALIRMLLCGFKEYTMSLEHHILQFQEQVNDSNREKLRSCGAMEQFQALIASAQDHQKYSLPNNEEWQSNCNTVTINHTHITNSIEKIDHHYSSTLHSVRNESMKESQAIYNNYHTNDTYKINDFQKKYLRGGDSMTCSNVLTIAIEFAKERHDILQNKRIKNLRESINYSHLRFCKIQNSLSNARGKLREVNRQLLQLQLDMLPSTTPTQQPAVFQLSNAMHRLSFDNANSLPADSLCPFDSLTTKNVIAQALETCQLLMNGMDTD